MTKYLLDTDILVDFFHDQRYARDLVSKLASEGTIYISILTVTELRAGFNAHQAAVFLPKLYELVEIIDISFPVAELAGKVRFDYLQKGKNLATVDTLIAATAIIEDFQLVTRNKKDYPMKELKLYPF